MRRRGDRAEAPAAQPDPGLGTASSFPCLIPAPPESVSSVPVLSHGVSLTIIYSQALAPSKKLKVNLCTPKNKTKPGKDYLWRLKVHLTLNITNLLA